MQNNRKPEPLDAATLILGYLVKHPDAKDTLEGIVTWWILRERIEQSVEKVSRALDSLIAQEFVMVKKYPNQKNTYQLNTEKLPAIKTILAKISENDF